MKNYKNTSVSIYNSYRRTKEIFTSLTEGKIGMYVCGPTVYGDPHLGHARGAITFDIVFRYFTHLGYKVRYVRNITDVGHLENEVEGVGEDKIAKKARLEEIEPMEVVQMYTKLYHNCLRVLNVLDPSIEPCASGHIPEQIALIEKILSNGYAYEVNGSVYLDMEKYTSAFPYGILSGKIIDDLIAGSRELDGQSEKRNPLDFALWKNAKPEHIMKWTSPWGVGFPGWHLECTAMSHKYLGEEFDIHGGGMDLQFPHHEGEIAQSCSAFGHEPVKYWMHNNMVTLDGQKMAKSKGNFITLNEMFSGEHTLLEQAYSPMTIRFFFLQSHYTSPIDFSNSALQAAEKGFQKLISALEVMDKISFETKTSNPDLEKELISLCDSCYEFMSDDFNTAKTLSSLFELSSKIFAFKNNQADITSISQETWNTVKTTYRTFITDVLGLVNEKSSQSSNHLDGVLNILMDMRKEAKAEKNWALSDKIRNNLAEIGVKIKDEKDGSISYTLE